MLRGSMQGNVQVVAQWVGRKTVSKVSKVKNSVRKRGLDVSQARRMVPDRSEWREFIKGNAWGVTWGMDP